MTTSGTYVFNQTRDKIIRMALRKVGAIQAGEIPNAQLTQDCSDQLNIMVKYWMASGIHIWTETEAIMYTQIGVPSYPLGAGTPTSVYTINTQTTTTAACISGATVIPVNSTYLFENGGTIGVTLDSGEVQYVTIQSFVAGTSATVTPALTDSSQSGQLVLVVTSGVIRPLRVPAARRWDSISQIETPMIPMSRLDYQAQPNKLVQGTITQWFYDPRGGANNYGTMYIWPTPSNTQNNNVKFTWYRPIQDFNTAANTPDLPQEWLNTLVWNLALHMAPEFGPPQMVWQEIKELAVATLMETQGWDREPEPTYFGVDFTRMGY